MDLIKSILFVRTDLVGGFKLGSVGMVKISGTVKHLWS